MIIDLHFDVYDTALPTNSLPDKSIQILTITSRFLTAHWPPTTYALTTDVDLLGNRDKYQNFKPNTWLQVNKACSEENVMKKVFMVATSAAVLMMLSMTSFAFAKTEGRDRK